jgi:hypothetical protein
MARECGPTRPKLLTACHQIAPIGIGMFDQIHLPFALVFLQACFARDSGINLGESLEIDQRMNAMLVWVNALASP